MTDANWEDVHPVHAVITTPTLRPDGTIVRGYDVATGTLFLPEESTKSTLEKVGIDERDIGLLSPDEPLTAIVAAAARLDAIRIIMDMMTTLDPEGRGITGRAFLDIVGSSPGRDDLRKARDAVCLVTDCPLHMQPDAGALGQLLLKYRGRRIGGRSFAMIHTSGRADRWIVRRH